MAAPTVETIQGGTAWYKLKEPMVLGEAPIYRESDSTLHWNDCLKEPAEIHILKLDPKTGDATDEHRVLKLEDSVSVQFFRKNHPNSYICAYYSGIAYLSESTGKLQIIHEIIPTSQRPFFRFNDGGIDGKGRFWLAEIDKRAMGFGTGKGSREKREKEYGEGKGRLWRYDGDGKLKKMLDGGLVCGNGVGWSPDNKTMYLHDSAGGIVYTYDFDLESGELGAKRILIDKRMPDGSVDGEPDGMVVDTTGNLYIAMWGSSSLQIFSPTGQHLKSIQFSAKRMSCPTWGGPNYDEIYLTSASDTSDEKRVGDEGGQMFRWKAGVKGLRKNEFAG